MISLKDLQKLWVGKRYQENPKLGYQCVAWVKKVVYLVHGIQLLSFSGSAINGWNTGSPFKGDKRWVRVENSPKAVPPAGAVVFFDRMYRGQKCVNPDGHVAFVMEGATAQKLPILEQNAGDGNGDGIGADAIQYRVLNYLQPARCLGWYYLKK